MKPSIMIITGSIVLGLLFLFAKVCFTGGAEDPEIQKILDDPSIHPIQKRALIDGIREKNRSIENARKKIKDPDPFNRADAIGTLGTYGVRDAIPDFKEALKDQIPNIRGLAAIALIELGERASVPPMATEDIKVLIGTSSGYRASSALKKLGVPDEEIKYLERAARDAKRQR